MKCIVAGNLVTTKFEMFNRVHSTEGLCPSITTMQGGNRQPKIIVYNTDRNMDKPQGKGWVYSEELGDWFRVRKLTARECLRLMDVRESDIDKMMSLDAKGKRCVSDAQLYKCAGNSICVQPMMLTLENIFFGDGEEEHRTLFD